MKKVILILLILCPLLVNAECNKEKHQEYVNVSNKITYDNSYSLSASSFTVTVYNIIDGMYVVYNGKKYFPNTENEVTVPKIPEGSNIKLDVYANDGCEQIKRITISEPYYNPFYNSVKCIKYQTELALCANQFTTSPVTESILDKAIYNLENEIDQTTDTRVEETPPTLYDRVREFMLNWGIKILLLVVTTVLSLAFFSDKFRKVKHGI